MLNIIRNLDMCLLHLAADLWRSYKCAGLKRFRTAYRMLVRISPHCIHFKYILTFLSENAGYRRFLALCACKDYEVLTPCWNSERNYTLVCFVFRSYVLRWYMSAVVSAPFNIRDCVVILYWPRQRLRIIVRSNYCSKYMTAKYHDYLLQTCPESRG